MNSIGAKALFSLFGQPLCHNVDTGEIEQRLNDEGRSVVSSSESLVGQQPGDRILDDMPDLAETGSMFISAPTDEGFHALLPAEIAVEGTVVSGIGEHCSDRCTDRLGKFKQMRKYPCVVDVRSGSDRPKRRAVCQSDNMVFWSRLAAVWGIRADQISAMLGSHTATVDDDSDHFHRCCGAGPQR